MYNTNEGKQVFSREDYILHGMITVAGWASPGRRYRDLCAWSLLTEKKTIAGLWCSHKNTSPKQVGKSEVGMAFGVAPILSWASVFLHWSVTGHGLRLGRRLDLGQGSLACPRATARTETNWGPPADTTSHSSDSKSLPLERGSAWCHSTTTVKLYIS